MRSREYFSACSRSSAASAAPAKNSIAVKSSGSTFSASRNACSSVISPASRRACKMRRFSRTASDGKIIWSWRVSVRCVLLLRRIERDRNRLLVLGDVENLAESLIAFGDHLDTNLALRNARHLGFAFLIGPQFK